jgi:hypothetical protein
MMTRKMFIGLLAAFLAAGCGRPLEQKVESRVRGEPKFRVARSYVTEDHKDLSKVAYSNIVESVCDLPDEFPTEEYSHLDQTKEARELKIVGFEKTKQYVPFQGYVPSLRITATNTIPGYYYTLDKRVRMEEGIWVRDVAKKLATTNSVSIITPQNEYRFYRVVGLNE